MIDKVIHQILLSDIPNAWIHQCLKSWNAMREYGFEVKVWTYKDVADLISDNYPALAPAFFHSRNFGEAGDMAKYAVIHQHSGCYVDWDIELFHPDKFADFLEKCPEGYLLIDPSNGTLAAECFAAAKGDHFMYQLMEDIKEIFEAEEIPPFAPSYTGPHRMRDTLRKFGEVKQTIVLVKDLFEYDYEEIRNANLNNHVEKPLIHYWMHTWIKD
ncbi:hypothetical protein [Chitinophaga sp. RAB17]|uniref:hypothetical protein n=1 Tax=Chitinophaga sp. RAB17 TaxID=3233049 RepID=UPI003F928DD0